MPYISLPTTRTLVQVAVATLLIGGVWAMWPSAPVRSEAVSPRELTAPSSVAPWPWVTRQSLDSPAIAGTLVSTRTPVNTAARVTWDTVQFPTRQEPLEQWRARGWFCPADFNRDDRIDDSDMALFVEVFRTREGPYAEFLDVTRDGWVDLQDLQHFILDSQAPCDPEEIAAKRLLVC